MHVEIPLIRDAVAGNIMTNAILAIHVVILVIHVAILMMIGTGKLASDFDHYLYTLQRFWTVLEAARMIASAVDQVVTYLVSYFPTFEQRYKGSRPVLVKLKWQRYIRHLFP